MAARPKLCYVLFEYQKRTDRHYYHLYELLEVLARDVDLFVIALRGDVPEIAGATHCAVMTRTSGAAAIAESLALLLRARRLGYRTFFVHYAMPIARRAAILCRLTGGRVYLWFSILVDKLLEDVDAGRVERPIHALTFRMVHGLVTSSRAMAAYYVEAFHLPPAKVKVVTSSVSLARFDPARYDRPREREALGHAPGDLVVLFVHGLERGKGALEIPEIASLVRARVPQVLFEIVGDGSRRAEIEAELRRRHMDDRVRLRGRVANLDVARYYAAADLFIMPSRFEEFSRTLLEAMAMGLPFVASDGSGPTLDYVSERQRPWIVPSLRTAEFAQKTAMLLQDVAERAALSAHGREVVREFSLERTRRELMREVLGIVDRDGA